MHTKIKFENFKGLTFISIEGATKGSDVIIFATSEHMYKMHHYQDCCESVQVEDIAGDISDLLNVPILDAYEESKTEEPDICQSQTWTFYRISTIKGTVVIRWLGESNGYYSEKVDLEQIS